MVNPVCAKNKGGFKYFFAGNELDRATVVFIVKIKHDFILYDARLFGPWMKVPSNTGPGHVTQRSCQSRGKCQRLKMVKA